MDSQATVRVLEIMLLGLGSIAVVALIVAMLQVRKTARQVESSVREMEGDLSATLRQTRSTLERVEKMAQGVDVLVREQVSPSIDSARWALAKAQQSVSTLTEGKSKVQRLAKAVQAVSGAGALAAFSRQVLRRRGGIGLAVLAAGAILQALLRRDHNPKAPTAGDDLPVAISERSKPKGRDGHEEVKTNGR